MAHAWRFADILRHFPVVEVDGQLWVDIAGERLTRRDVLVRWEAYCNEAGDSPEDEQTRASSPSKEDVVLAVVGKKTRNKVKSTAKGARQE